MHAESVCVCVPMLYGHMLLHCSDMLSCPNLQLTTASSSSWGSSPMSYLSRNTCYSIAITLSRVYRTDHEVVVVPKSFHCKCAFIAGLAEAI